MAQELSGRLDELLGTDLKDLSKVEAKWILPKVCSCGQEAAVILGRTAQSRSGKCSVS